MSVLTAACMTPGCSRLAGVTGNCEYHLMLQRRAAGTCPNCGEHRKRVPVMNELLGRQRLRYGLPVWAMRCAGCGREQRPYAEEA